MTEEWELPEGWSSVRIGDLCELNPKHPPNIDKERKVSFVPMAAVCEQKGEIVGAEDRAYGEVKKGYTHFADGDVIFAKITPCMENGKAASVRGMTNGLACGTTEFFVLRSRGLIEQDYLFHFIRQESYRKAARATMQSGVGQARVPKEFVVETELPLPPLAEQRRIVERIEGLQARSRKAREALEAVPALLEQYRQAVLAAAFRGDLTADWRDRHPDAEPASALLDRIRRERRRQWEAKYPKKKYVEPEPVDPSKFPELPDGWCWASLSEVSSAVEPLCYGVVQPGPDCEQGVKLIRVCDVRDGEVCSNDLRAISEDVDREYSRSRVLGGELLITIVGTIGRVAVVPESLRGSNIARAIAKITPAGQLGSAWLACWFATTLMQEWLVRESCEVARKTLNLKELEQAVIPLAPVAEMGQLLKIVPMLLDRSRTMRSSVLDSLREFDQLDQSILAKAFRGELVEQDPDDEPAAVLLERIRSGGIGKPTAGGAPLRAREIVHDLLVLLRACGGSLGRGLLELGLVLMRNDAVRTAVLDKTAKIPRAGGAGGPLLRGLDHLLGDLERAKGWITIGPDASRRIALTAAAPSTAGASAADLRRADEARRALAQVKQERLAAFLERSCDVADMVVS